MFLVWMRAEDCLQLRWLRGATIGGGENQQRIGDNRQRILDRSVGLWERDNQHILLDMDRD